MALQSSSPALDLHELPVLLRGDTASISVWLRRWSNRRGLLYVAIILLGAGLFGAAIGSWRDAWQALYVAVKFPLVILITTLANALLNGMLAPLLGLNIGFRQSLLVVLISFTIASAILGSFSPVTLFIAWNTPLVTEGSRQALLGYSFMKLTLVGLIAFAGVVAHVRLLPLLKRLGGSAPVAWKVMLAWLAGNLLLGSQICWVLRPFIGRPDMEVEFLGKHPIQSNFFEQVIEAVRQLISQ